MFENKKIIAIIPARGGSKGIPNKNIYPLCDKPLIAYTIEAAKKSKYIDNVVVSTDSEKISEVSKQYGAQVPFLRPENLATDTAKTIDVLIDALDRLQKCDEKYHTLVLLQPTSPLRSTEDIDSAIELFFANGCESLVSVTEVNINPVLIRKIVDGKACPILNQSSTVRRQDFEKYYRVNGAIYINKIDELTCLTSLNDNSLAYIMPTSRSLDIDTQDDIKEAEKIISIKLNKQQEI
ncbi:MAG: acylneuraminate cytidylyltransferase family protein [Butyrivibrio sp.]|nr:acylneuraminate cytidylyltransferase family protein [Butyrivibrio sp.]